MFRHMSDTSNPMHIKRSDSINIKNIYVCEGDHRGINMWKGLE